MKSKYTAKRRINRIRTIEDIPKIFDSPPTNVKSSNLYYGKILGYEVMISWDRKSGCVLHAIDKIELEKSYKSSLQKIIDS